jgi:hypothetical protein
MTPQRQKARDYLIAHNIQKSEIPANKFGQLCTRICVNTRVPLESVPDPSWGQVYVYPLDILNEALRMFRIS